VNPACSTGSLLRIVIMKVDKDLVSPLDTSTTMCTYYFSMVKGGLIVISMIPGEPETSP
jgi:hypothetical protein